MPARSPGSADEDGDPYIVTLDDGVVHDSRKAVRRCYVDARARRGITEAHPTLTEAQATGAEPCHWCLR